MIPVPDTGYLIHVPDIKYLYNELSKYSYSYRYNYGYNYSYICCSNSS